MSVHKLASARRPVKRVPRDEIERDDTIRRQEISLLSLLVAKHPERAKELLRRLGESMKAA